MNRIKTYNTESNNLNHRESLKPSRFPQIISQKSDWPNYAPVINILGIGAQPRGLIIPENYRAVSKPLVEREREGERVEIRAHESGECHYFEADRRVWPGLKWAWTIGGPLARSPRH